jgi:hypothetical protein
MLLQIWKTSQRRVDTLFDTAYYLFQTLVLDGTANPIQK